jgi:hypothetical protein
MDHVVYLDFEGGEMRKLFDCHKTMIIRGAAIRRMPYGRVKVGDVLYFVNNNAEGLIKAMGRVARVFNSERLTREESVDLVLRNQNNLQLNNGQLKRWAGKRYLILIEIAEIKYVHPFKIDRSDFGIMDDWFPVDDIMTIKCQEL